MSGICGIIHLDDQLVSEHSIQNMVCNMNNHGNDKESIWIDKQVGFGHKMLWNTPESIHEDQPLVGEDSSFVLICDARIDNRSELIEKLELKPKKTIPITDAELILCAFHKWKEESPKYLIGDFAFAIWDNNSEQLFCARDHIGIKNFYYYRDDKQFVFASEINPIFTTGVHQVLDIDALRSNLIDWQINCSSTYFEDIFRLLPAHSLTISKDSFEMKRYWFPEEIKTNFNISDREASRKLKSLLEVSVSDRMRTGYPIATELSGGVDSSSIFALAKKINLDTLSISARFKNLECDEKKYIDAVIKKYPSKHFEVDIANDEDLDELLNSYYNFSADWPGGGEFLFTQKEFELLQRQRVRVLLTGYGSDELTAGNFYIFSDLFRRFRFIQLYKELKTYKFSWKLIKRYLIKPLWHKRISNDDSSLCYKIISPILEYTNMYNIKTALGANTSIFLDSHPYQAAGKYGVEVCHPFLDKRVIEFLLSMPSYYLMRDGKNKILLREAMKNDLPDSIFHRKDKADFIHLIKQRLKKVKLSKVNKIIKLGIINNDELNNYTKEQNDHYGIYNKWQIFLYEKWLTKIKK